MSAFFICGCGLLCLWPPSRSLVQWRITNVASLRQSRQHEMLREQPALFGILESMPLDELAGAELGIEAQQRLGSHVRLFDLAGGREACRQEAQVGVEARIERRRPARPAH